VLLSAVNSYHLPSSTLASYKRTLYSVQQFILPSLMTLQMPSDPCKHQYEVLRKLNLLWHCFGHKLHLFLGW